MTQLGNSLFKYIFPLYGLFETVYLFVWFFLSAFVSQYNKTKYLQKSFLFFSFWKIFASDVISLYAPSIDFITISILL